MKIPKVLQIKTSVEIILLLPHRVVAHLLSPSVSHFPGININAMQEAPRYFEVSLTRGEELGFNSNLMNREPPF